MPIFIFALLITFLKGQDNYEELINEKVSEEYCNDVIKNLISIIDEAYVYSDFIKSPKQPEGYDNYIPKVDLINELNNVNKKDRYFYDFYRDIQGILAKTRDGHFSVNAEETPNGFSLYDHYFCVPFRYLLEETFDDENNVNDTYFIIQYDDEFCDKEYSNDTYDKISQLEGKKINKINNMSPSEYFEKMSTKYSVIHSPQSRYIYTYSTIHTLFTSYYPFIKEELNLSIEFEGNELLEIEYKLKTYEYLSEDYKKFFLEQRKKFYKGYRPIIDLKNLEYKYKVKKGLISEKITRNINWDIYNEEENIKCKVDEDNKYNVIYQNSFYPDDFYDYENIMEQCFEEFYSNDYKIIIIEDLNGGGYSDLCIPFYQYLSPKMPKSSYSAIKNSDTNFKDYIQFFQVLDPEICMPFTDYEKLLNGEEDKYPDGVVHKRSKIYDNMDVYNKVNMEKNRKYYLSMGKTKKPTEIIVFTDGYSFSCTSNLISTLQTHGSSIIVGYNRKPDLDKKDFDASQSNSYVFQYETSEYVKNLANLGYSSSITCEEEFSPNDKNTPKTPYEFLVNPVDEISNINAFYNDEIYDRFIKEADKIFNDYNDLENGKCNPDNKYLYFETSDCDSILNIEKAHGGYLCGNDGKWNKSNCIAAYCDEGFILNDERNECIKNNCDEISVVEKSIKEINGSEEFIIEPKTAYYFYIDDEDNSYYFKSNENGLMFYYEENYNKVYIDNNTLLKNEDYIYINTFLNSSDNTKLIVSNENYIEPINQNNTYYQYKKKEKGLKTWKIVLIIIGLVAALLIATIAAVFARKKNYSNSEEYIKSNYNSNINIAKDLK